MRRVFISKWIPIGVKNMRNLPWLGLLLLTLVGCGASSCSSFYNVPPNMIGMVLTPTGYDTKVYSPGQVDLGTKDNAGQGNTLVLIQRSGVEVKEAFLGNDNGEDHRCLVGPGAQPMTLDVRLILALPNYETADGKKDLARLFQLGNPTLTTGGDGRVLTLTAESIYRDQAQLQVRGRIRQICASYKDFNDAYKAFGDGGDTGFSAKIEKAVAQSLGDNHVPLHLVSAVVSNMKPDESVIAAITAQQAAHEQTRAIQVITDFLNDDASGMRRMVYKYQVLQQIISTADKNGRSTIFLTDTNAPVVVPLNK